MEHLILQHIASFLSLEDTLAFRSTCSSIQENMTSIATINTFRLSTNVVKLVHYIYFAGRYLRKMYWDTNLLIQSDSSRYLNFEFLENLDISFEEESFQKCRGEFLAIIEMGMLKNLKKLRIFWNNCSTNHDLNLISDQIFSGVNLPHLEELKVRGLVISSPTFIDFSKPNKYASSPLILKQYCLQRRVQKYQDCNETHKKLKILNLNDCFISNSLLFNIINKNYTNLLSLNFTNCSLDIEELSMIFGSQTACGLLESLNISHNHIDDKGILHLTRVIGVGWGMFLKTLDLSGNMISDLGFIQLLNVIIPDYSSTNLMHTIKKLEKTRHFNFYNEKEKEIIEDYNQFNYIGLLPRLEIFRINGNYVSTVGLKYFYYRIKEPSCILFSKKEDMKDITHKENSCNNKGSQRKESKGEKVYPDELTLEISQASEKLRIEQFHLFERKLKNANVNRSGILSLNRDKSNLENYYDNSYIENLYPKDIKIASLKLLEVAANKIDFEGFKYLYKMKLLFMEQYLIEKLNSILEINKISMEVKVSTSTSPLRTNCKKTETDPHLSTDLHFESQQLVEELELNDKVLLQQREVYNTPYFWPRLKKLTTINITHNNLFDASDKEDTFLLEIEEDWKADMCNKYQRFFGYNEIFEYINTIQKDMQFFLLTQIII